MSPQRIRNIVLPLCAVLLAASCSTTRRLGSDEVLYTGVKKILIEPDSGVVLTPAAESAVKEPLSVAPNNPLYSPYLRTPLPVGLWAYNHLYTPKEKGFKYWFYKRLAKQPVLISKVQPQLRTKVAEQVLENYGSFGSRAADSLLYRKRGRKAKVRYTLGIAPAWHYSSIAYPQAVGGLKQLIDSLQATSLLRVGAQYNLDSLTLERKRISQLLRNRGYYYFRPEYMEYLADTTAGRRQVALRLNLRPNVPQAALMPYRVGDVTVRLTNIKPGPADTLRLPDATVIARRPLEAALETDVTSKSNSFIGPGVTFRVSNNNLFRGGEVLSVKLNGSYEWQTGNKNSGGRSSRLNSYELGLNANLDIPRLLLPRSMTRRQKYPGSTSFQLGVDLMNRPSFFRLIAFSGSAGYNFQTSPYSRHSLTVFKLTYNKLLHTTDSFDRTMDENPAIAMSFRNQFVPSINYTYTFERTYGATGNRRFYWQNSVTSAGNLLSGILRAFGERQPQTLFGNRFSQFVKEVSEVKFYHRIGRRNNWLATRLLVGAGYAYGNSEVMPYSEQFYIGGANSIRAFTIRSLGPGSYRPPADDRNGYLDQTGDFKLEANIEYRFGIMGRLNGAVFLDAGNIWLLKKDPKRPGAELKWKGFLNDIALGTGFGLRYDISYLVIRADLGIGLHTPYPNPDKKGYYNISSFKDGLGFHLAIGYPF